jgi:hypothetical protein
MKYKILGACALFAFAVAATPAQTKTTMTGKCDKPSMAQSAPAGDKDGHAYMIQQGSCTAVGDVGDAKGKSGMFSEHDDATATHVMGWGMYVETLDSGDKIFYSYTTTASTKDNMITTGGNTYKITGGTGKMKGIKGSGTCKLKGEADGGLTYDCTGDYMMAAAAPAKK